MNFIKKHTVLWIVLTSVMALLMIVFIVANIVLQNFAGNLNEVLGIQTYRIEKVEVDDPNELIYHKSNYFTGTAIDSTKKIIQTVDQEKLEADEKLLCAQLEEEGAVLLKNENSALPLKENAQVTLFSQSSARLVYGGTGSGAVKADPSINLKSALETGGKVTVNPTMWDWYTKGAGASYEREIPSLKHDSTDYKINEASWATIAGSAQNRNSFALYGDAAIFVLGRSGGEESDVPRAGAPDSKNGDYLVLNEAEEIILEQLAAAKTAGTFKSIIVLLNTSNMVQLDFVDNPTYNIDACMWIGGVGMTGINGVASVLRGDVNPSGRTIETYYNNNRANPVLANFGKTVWNNGAAGLDAGNNYHSDIYVVYQEGIYLGYRYFETRYEDYVMGIADAGAFDYAAAVKYPFGSGLSYSEFTYEDFEVLPEEDSYTVTVDVKNNGARAGKHTIMIYLQSEYTEYDLTNKIEKSAVNLVGFEKVEIAAGATVPVTVTIEKNDLRIYDANGAGTYIYDAGNYYLTVGKNAHDATNNILAEKGKTPANTADRMDAAGDADLVYAWNNASIDADIFSKSKWTGVKIENQFDNVDINRYDGKGSNRVEYVTRNNWSGTVPASVAKIDVTDKMKLDGLVRSDAQRAAHRKEYMDDNGLTEDMDMPVLGADPNPEELLNVVKLKDEPLNSDKWDELMDMVTFSELENLIGDGFHHTREVASINLPGTKNENGPQGLTASLVGGHSSMAYTTSDIRAATYNRDLVRKVGEYMGEDCLAADYAGMYAPGANLHRSNYQGRNFEYYSEDPYVSGQIGRGEVEGITSKGVFVFMKHFALNEQESGRFGVATFVNEQAFRELYLTGFENCLGNMPLGSVMSSYNRIGVIWAGAHRGLMVDVLRKEWNSGSANITDCGTAGAVHMEGNIGIFGGTNFWDGYPNSYENVWNSNDPVTVHALKASAKLMVQTIAKSAGINGISALDKIIPVTPWWQLLIITLIIVFAVLTAGFGALLGINIWQKKKKS